mmetsp:Transcript_17782/g.43899  ORF Transcript_17782/g.43899 Transcript_17782/m.43899 type:complete len:135 (-) Transcript_17782:3370-3774(-)
MPHRDRKAIKQDLQAAAHQKREADRAIDRLSAELRALDIARGSTSALKDSEGRWIKGTLVRRRLGTVADKRATGIVKGTTTDGKKAKVKFSDRDNFSYIVHANLIALQDQNWSKTRQHSHKSATELELEQLAQE